MKVKVQYCTKESVKISELVSSPVYKEIEVEPIKVVRSAAWNTCQKVVRFNYFAVFAAPEDAEYPRENGTLVAQIIRKANPHFNPKHYTF